MAKFLPGPTVATVSGSIGGTTFSRNRYGAYMRNRAKPVVNTSEAAMAAKVLMTTASQAWQNLTVGQRLAWSEWARRNPIVGSLGDVQVVSGHAAYVGIYCRMSIIGETPLDLPPITPAPAGLTAASFVATEATGTVAITFLATPLAADHYLWIRGCYVASAGITWIANQLRLCGVSVGADVSPFEAGTLIEARLGDMTVGHRLILWVSVASGITGLLSSPRYCEGTIV